MTLTDKHSNTIETKVKQEVLTLTFTSTRCSWEDLREALDQEVDERTNLESFALQEFKEALQQALVGEDGQ